MASVLVVDNEIAYRLAICRRIERDGHDVRQANDGLEGLTKLTEDLPDLVVLDLKMPGLDGRGVLEVMQQVQGLRQLPVLLITADAFADLKSFAPFPNVVGLMFKHQCSMSQVLATVRSHLPGEAECA